MAEESFQEKTEKPSPKKISDARKKGQVAKSREIPSVFILMVSLAVFYFIGSAMFANIAEFMKYMFQNISRNEFQNASLYSYFISVSIKFIKIMFPLMIAVFIAGILSHIIQFGFLFSGEALTPKLSKLDPLKGMKKIISLKALVELLKSLIKIVVIGSVAYIILKSESKQFVSLIEMSVDNIFSMMGLISLKISIYICSALSVLAILDYLFQRWQHEKDLRMTKQEVKEEKEQPAFFQFF